MGKSKAAAGKKKAAAKPAAPKRSRLGLLAVLVGVALAGWLGHAYLTLPGADEVAQLAEHPPRSTALIDDRVEEARAAHKKLHRQQRWTPISDVAPELIECVLASEDARFFVHDGIDVAQLRQALEKDLRTRRYARGASTLTQQLAKNLWLSERKSLLRKAEEAILARRLEDGLTKERILELYLNEVEWGEGIFGAGAASKVYFGKSPRDLSLGESAILAAMLPAPRKLSPLTSPGPLLPRAQHVLDRVAEEHLATPLALDLARVQVERILAGAPRG